MNHSPKWKLIKIVAYIEYPDDEYPTGEIHIGHPMPPAVMDFIEDHVLFHNPKLVDSKKVN